jgi:FkbM family methyltransferase
MKLYYFPVAPNPRGALLSLCLVVLVFATWPAGAQHLYYSFGQPSRDGIGKFYMGREISHVMGHRGAGWLERASREREERTDLLLEALMLEPGDVVADIGAGTGYFSLPMARSVAPGGRVLAVDIQPEMLSIIERRAANEGITNIDLVLGTESDPKLPASGVDVVLMVDAYHEFSHPREVMEVVVDALSDRGLVVLVEYRGEDPRVPIKPLHKMTVEQATREMAAVGLERVKLVDILPQQHIMVFARAADAG